MNRRAIPALLAIVLAASLVLTGCASSEDSDPSALLGTWSVEAFGGTEELKPAGSAATPTITFEAPEVSGTGGVNSFGGTYEAGTDSTISFGEIVSTKMAGSEAANRQEAQFFGALEGAERYEFNGDALMLSGADNDTLLVLVRQ